MAEHKPYVEYVVDFIASKAHKPKSGYQAFCTDCGILNNSWVFAVESMAQEIGAKHQERFKRQPGLTYRGPQQNGINTDKVPPAVRNDDPETSHEAAESIKESAVSQRTKILGEYAKAGADGLTDEEAGIASGYILIRNSCYWKRCSELRDSAMGYTEWTETWRVASSGRRQRVHAITAKGKDFLGLVAT